MPTNNFFTKVPDSLIDDLHMRIISFDEYALIVYLLQNANKKTGVVVTKSGSLVNAINKDRTWVHSRLTTLKNKSRIQSATSGQPRLNQRQGDTKPYPIRLSDHIPYSQITSEQPANNQWRISNEPGLATSGNSEKPSGAAETLGKTESGKILALKKDLDKDKERIYDFEKIPYKHLPKAEAAWDMSQNERTAVDTFGDRYIGSLGSEYYRSSSDDTVMLYNLLRIHTPSSIIEMANRGQDGTLKEVLPWIVEECGDDR